MIERAKISLLIRSAKNQILDESVYDIYLVMSIMLIVEKKRQIITNNPRKRVDTDAGCDIF